VVVETSQLLVPPAAAAESNIGMNSFAIDVEVIDDDVVIYSSRPLPQVCSTCLVLAYVLRLPISFTS
jgi:hypothetical protein